MKFSVTLHAIALSLITTATVASAQVRSKYTPIRLQSGTNAIANIAGDGKAGTISLVWRDNGNAWGYDIYTVVVGGSVATVEGKNSFSDTPHTGEFVIRSVRFARASFRGKMTTHALVADRNIVSSVPGAASTTIKIYALVQNVEGTGTPYEFELIRNYRARRLYCNAEMALKTELGLSLSRSYQGLRTRDGC